MKIALVVPSLRRTAPVFVAAELAEGFARCGHEVVMFHLDDVVEFRPSVPHRRLDRHGADALLDFDVVHSHMLRPDAAAWRVARRRSTGRRPWIVTTIHNYVYEDLANTHGRLVAGIVSRAWMHFWRGLDARVVLSRDAEGYYRGRMPGLAFTVIPNGRSPHRPAMTHPPALDMVQALRARYRIIGANALVSPRKGLDQVVRALVDLPEFAFVLAGEGPELETLQALARSIGVADRFMALGFQAEARALLDAYDLYAMPSRSEGLPLAMLEAAAAGLPIVCSRLPVFGEVFDESQAVFFHLDDVAGLVDAVRRAWDRREEIGVAARRRFEMAYSIDAAVKRYLVLFDQRSRVETPRPG